MKKGYLYIVLATLLFSSMEIALKLLSLGFNPLQTNFIRFLIGSIILLPLALKNMKEKKISIHIKDIIFFLITGFICVAVSMTFYQLAVIWGKASVVAILFSCNPVFVIPLAYIILQEKIYKSTIYSMVLSLIGIVFIMNPLHLGNNMLSIIMTLLAAVFFALYGVIGKTTSSRYGGVISSCFSFLMGSLEMLIIIGISRIGTVSSFMRNIGLSEFASIPVLKGITLQSLPGLIYLGVFVTGLGYTFYFLAMEKTSAATASLVFYIKPALASVFAMIILHDPITINIILGIILIAAGSLITFIPQMKKSKVLVDSLKNS